MFVIIQPYLLRLSFYVGNGIMTRKYVIQSTKGNMSDYYRQQGTHKHKWFKRIFRAILTLLFITILGIIGYFIYDIYSESKASDTASKLSNPISSTVIANNNIQTSPYFQFQAPAKWRAIANETKEGHYVYRQYNSQLVEQDLVIDVNNSSQEVLALTQTSRVQAVSINESGSIDLIGIVSDPCKKAVKAGTEKTPQIVTMNKVTFPCNPDSTSYTVVVGLSGGTNIMVLPRPGGKTAPYKITYRNLSALPNSRDFSSIIKTFETR